MKYQIEFKDQDRFAEELSLSHTPLIGDLLKLPNPADDEIEYWTVVSVQDQVITVVGG
jgi:hypothetical protein